MKARLVSADLRHWLLFKGSLIRSAFKKYHLTTRRKNSPGKDKRRKSRTYQGNDAVSQGGGLQRANGEERRGHGQPGATLGLLAGTMVLSRPQGEKAGRKTS